MKLLTLNVLLSFFVIALFEPTLAEQCMPNTDNPCIAKCSNGTVLDLTKAFKFPLSIDSEYNKFTWSPCTGYNCSDYYAPNDCAVCQYSSMNCGRYKQPLWLLNSRDPYEFSIEYVFGSEFSMSVFTFHEVPDQKDITVNYTSMNPMFQFNFVVKGKCIGQPSCKQESKFKG